MTIQLLAEATSEIASMDVSVLKMLVSTFGGAGLSMFAAWMMYKSFLAQVEKKDQAYIDRIRALEEANKEFSKYVKEIHIEMREMQSSMVNTSLSVIRENTEMMKKVEERLEQICDTNA